MRSEPGVLATFDEPSAAARAIRALRDRGIRDLHAGLPAPFPEVVAALGKPRSAIDYATIPGALLGLVVGILLPVLTSLSWPLVTGGKEIVSTPAFVVIIFDVTVLVGSIANLAAVTVRSFLGGGTGAFPREERFNGDQLAVFAAGGGDEAERVFLDAGAVAARRAAPTTGAPTCGTSRHSVPRTRRERSPTAPSRWARASGTTAATTPWT